MDFEFLKKMVGASEEPCLGVDIGTTSIKLVELSSVKDKITLTNYGALETFGYLERVNTAFQASTLKLFEQDIVGHIKTLLAKTNVRARRAVASLPSFAVFSTMLDLPPMPEKEIAQALQFKARQYIPMPISSVSLDWVRIGEQKVLLLAIPNELIEKHTIIFREAGLVLQALEVEGMSLARSLQYSDPTLIIDIGSRSTGLFVAGGGSLFLMGQTDFSGASLTHGIASGLNIAMRRAEDLKKQRGIVNLGFGADQELSTLLLPLIDAILEEAKRLTERYQTTYENKVIKIVLSGGGALLPGLSEYIQKQLEMPTEKARPFAAVGYPARAEAAIVPLGPSLAVAAGAALRAFS